jgi:hypothetical protein
MRIRYGAVENPGNVFLSRSLCYAMLAGLAIALLVQTYAAPGAESWSAQLAQVSAPGLQTSGFHLSQLLASARISAGILREELHNTWLFLYVFLVVLVIVLAWSILERRRLKLGIGRREVYWLGGMSLSVIAAAVMYGAGTNGMMARSYPAAVPISDALALGFVLALPVFAWSRMQRRKEAGDEEESYFEPRPLFTTLHLNFRDEDMAVPARARFQESMMRQPEQGMALPNSLLFAPDPKAVAAIDRLLETTVLTVVSPSEIELAEEVPAVQPLLVAQPAAISTATASVAVAPLTEDFRENLAVMNTAWNRIESAGSEIDQWFDEQRRQALSRLETYPGARRLEARSLPENFLNEKLSAVDADWAAIRRSALEIARWFGDVPPAAS